MSGIGVVTNPRSRKNRKNPRLARQLAYILGERHELAAPADLAALDETAIAFRERGIDILCINGGDGTLHQVLSSMARVYGDAPLPRVAILRGGTMNTIAKGMGIYGTPGDLLDYVVERYHADAPMATTRRWLLRVDGRHCGFLFGTGVMARYLEAYYAGSEPTPLKAGWVLARAVGSALVGGPFARSLMEPEPLEVSVDGQVWPKEAYVSVGAGTANDVGLGFRPFQAALTHPGRLAAVGIACGPYALVRALGRYWLGRPANDPGIVEDVAERLVIRGRGPVKYMLDGDFYVGGEELVLEVGPGIDFIVPER